MLVKYNNDARHSKSRGLGSWRSALPIVNSPKTFLSLYWEEYGWGLHCESPDNDAFREENLLVGYYQEPDPARTGFLSRSFFPAATLSFGRPDCFAKPID